MIRNKQDLRFFLNEDLKRRKGGIPNIVDYIMHNEKWFIYQLLKELRYVEYYMNISHEGLMGGGK